MKTGCLTGLVGMVLSGVIAYIVCTYYVFGHQDTGLTLKESAARNLLTVLAMCFCGVLAFVAGAAVAARKETVSKREARQNRTFTPPAPLDEFQGIGWKVRRDDGKFFFWQLEPNGQATEFEITEAEFDDASSNRLSPADLRAKYIDSD